MNDPRMHCKTCVFFREFTEPEAAGDCVRYPPVPLLSEKTKEIATTYPIVKEHWGCGEHPRKRPGKLDPFRPE
jgi:hypothetical protein